jgi:parvulin-like peptidyl-prolyl isomerase
VRTLRAIEVNWKGAEMATADVTRTREEAWRLALELVARLRSGVSYDELSRNHSSLPNRHLGGVLGTFAKGMLGPKLDAFLFGAELDAVSEPLESPRGWLVLQRVESQAAARTLLVSGNTPESRQRCVELATRARAGEDFVRLCREHSEDDLTRARDGALAIFERGPSDQLLKAAAFSLSVGALSQPIESPLGWHLVQRVPVDSLDPALADPVWVRARAILIAQKVVPLGSPSAERSSERALEIVMKLQERVLAGEDMAELARTHCDDFGGRERAGDLGWIHRRHPNKLHFLDSLYAAMPGELLEPFETSAGWVLMRREH